jgi:hypothetical protein
VIREVVPAGSTRFPRFLDFEVSDGGGIIDQAAPDDRDSATMDAISAFRLR